MAKKQSRRTISVRAVTYATVRDDCARRALSVSEYVEALIAADHKARGIDPMTLAVKAVKRQEVARIARSMPSLPLLATDPAPHLNALKSRRGAVLREHAEIAARRVAAPMQQPLFAGGTP